MYYHRDNIHPYTECQKREKSAIQLSQIDRFPLIIQEGYNLSGFLKEMTAHENDRCSKCYERRLWATANVAKSHNCDSFSTTLLYSKYQNHERIISVAQKISQETGLDFYYEDFRIGWEEGIQRSKELNLYRQSYCGCIYSEKERYYKEQK